MFQQYGARFSRSKHSDPVGIAVATGPLNLGTWPERHKQHPRVTFTSQPADLPRARGEQVEPPDGQANPVGEQVDARASRYLAIVVGAAFDEAR